jgi:predicted acyltransferase
VAISILFLVAYWLLLAGYGPMSIEDNLVRNIDLSVIGEAHMYRERGVVFDPEGLLSTMPAVVNVTAGYVIGLFVQRNGKTANTVWKLILWGLALIMVGSVWNYFFPFNKKLWTSSYVLLTTGIDAFVIGVLLFIVDIKNTNMVTRFFTPMGKNPLFIYVLSNLLLFFLILPVAGEKIFFDWINDIFFQKIAPGPSGAFLFSLAFTMICWLVAWAMDKRKWYVRL